MLNQKLKASLSVGFLGCCFAVGIGISLLMRYQDKILVNDSVVKTATASLESRESKKLATAKKENAAKSIVIKAVGDVIPGTNYPNYRLPDDYNNLIPKPVRAYLSQADILFGNFETTLTNYRYSAKDVSRGQVFAFRSPPEYAKLFSDVGFNVFNVANNHARDFGMVGFKDTMKNLKNAGIETLGHKNQILFLEKNNNKIAMIGFAPYGFYNSIHDLEAAKALIKKARKEANIVIISMHVGAEGTGALHTRNKTEYFYGENRGNSIKFARAMIDAGADLVLGHGPHVPRAMEMYKGKLIAYSLGNFLGYRTLSTVAQAGYSMILEVQMSPKGNVEKAKIIPVRMDRQGIPYIDQNFNTVQLVRYLNKSDFPDSSVKINQQGELIVARENKQN
ncbi:putative enzyme of poly-gamma-glutamate biosynthesis (capsule formation) [Rivularia sp. PCC 7116]|uniref:CapA family protein n=1 Tax=Rivularia sp. PCC 7116 TaxID=373994 RepID=UPI00029F2B65|nr:CapA family protein [Rivularia sp. PCC 7116]AFY58766.1 putative enzyme of poly-gamma-glutamate biosynthesis (capsule formation) [Rivularia sp. PCC 7116]